MIKTICSIFVCFCISNTFAQEYYYWANGKKYPIELYAEKQYVLTKSASKEMAAQGLGISALEISDFKKIVISKTIKSNPSSIGRNSSELHWTFVNRSLEKEKINLSEIIYAAPSFMVNGKQVGLSQYFYVKLKQEEDTKLLENLAKENNVDIVGNDSFMPLWFILSCDKNSKGNALEMANLFYETGRFASAQPDLMEDYSANCRNDTFFNQQWHLNNTGQSGGTVGNDIRICQAWDMTMGCGNIIVAVLDQGIEAHPDFNTISPLSFDSETGATPATTIYGGHGVAVAGVIGATTNNSLGVAGVAPNTQLMSINNSLAATPLSRQNRAAGINFAWQNGASVINNSWGSSVVFQIIDDAIQNAVTQGRNGLGTVVVFASGNDSNSSIGYPSSNANTISVGAIGRTASRASFSNFGTGLDVVAPGVEITTTDRQGTAGFNTAVSPGGDFATLDGTSFAAPQVSGIAALILSFNPNLTVQQVRNIIQSTTDKVGGVTYTLNAGEQAGLTWNNQMGYGRVNALRALQASLPTITGGTNTLCTTSNSTYNLSFIPGNSTVTWSVSPASYFATTGGANTTGTGGTATIRASSNFAGSATISFVIQGTCNTNTVTRTFWVGFPQISNQRVDGSSYYGPTSICPGSHWLQVTPLGTTNNANWTVQSGVPFVVTPNYLDFYMYSNVSSIAITANASNVCGTGPNAAFYLMKKTWGCPSSFSVAASPNPVADELSVTTISTSDFSDAQAIFGADLQDIPPNVGRAVLLDGQAQSVVEGQWIDGKLKLNVKGLKKGLYFLHIFVDDKIYKEQIIVE